jgi:hypothetical protein
MRRRKQNILLNLLLDTGAYLLYSKRHQLGDIEALARHTRRLQRDRAPTPGRDPQSELRTALLGPL